MCIRDRDKVDPEVYEGLKANFEGECTEVGMYIAVSYTHLFVCRFVCRFGNRLYSGVLCCIGT